MQWRYKNDAKYREWLDNYRKTKLSAYCKKRYIRLKSRIKAQGDAYRQRVMVEAFSHYGKVCYCCGEENPLFLTLGHINNDGAAHRKRLNGEAGKTGTGYAFYLWLKRHKYPSLPLQVECYNCNCGKNRNRGVCPHVTTSL